MNQSAPPRFIHAMLSFELFELAAVEHAVMPSSSRLLGEPVCVSTSRERAYCAAISQRHREFQTQNTQSKSTGGRCKSRAQRPSGSSEQVVPTLSNGPAAQTHGSGGQSKGGALERQRMDASNKSPQLHGNRRRGTVGKSQRKKRGSMRARRCASGGGWAGAPCHEAAEGAGCGGGSRGGGGGAGGMERGAGQVRGS